MPRTFVIAVDESECALSAAQWAFNNLVRPDDFVHLVGVMAPVYEAMAPGMPASAAAAGFTPDFKESFKEEYALEEKRVQEVLEQERAKLGQAKCQKLSTRCLAPSGGASGVAGGITAYAKKANADLVVLGSRGIGGAKSTLMSIVGLGSVSSYCLHHLTSPVCLVRGTGLGGPRKASNKVLVALDGSDTAKHAQRWAVDNALGPRDELYLLGIGDAGAQATFQDTVTAAVEVAAKQVDPSRIVGMALESKTVGPSIKQYAEANGIDLVVMGSRGMGAVKRALHSLVGTGSVSDWCSHNLECPLIVVKGELTGS